MAFSWLSSSVTTLWHPAVVVTLLWINLFKALFLAWRRFVLTQWSQSHPLFRLNGKNRLPVSWRYPPPILACTHSSMRSPLLTTLSVSHPSHSNPSLPFLPSSSHSLAPLPFPLSPSLPLPFSHSFIPRLLPFAVKVALPHAESHVVPDWRKVT